jgi:hypothetical protein
VTNPKMQLPKKPKPNKAWMKGFVIEPKLTDADHVSMDKHAYAREYHFRSTKGRR